MKGQQMPNLGEYKELEKLEMSKEVVVILLGMGILAWFVSNYFFFSLYTLFTGEHEIWLFETSDKILISISLLIGTLVLHELIHGVFVSKYGGKPSYGAGIAYFIPYLYTTTKTKTLFLRNQFIVILIAPLVFISLAGIGLMALFPSMAHWFLLPLTIHTSGTVGDLWMTRNLLRYPKHVLLEDRKTWTIIHGKETDKPNNISTTGFGLRFYKVFTLCFIILYFFVMLVGFYLSPRTESFTIGHFTIIEFYSSKSGNEFHFGFNFPVMPLLAISMIVGLVYAIIKPGNPKKKNLI